MFKRKLTTHILTLACLFGTAYTFTDETDQKQTLASNVSNQYLNATFGAKKAITTTPNETADKPKTFWAEVKKKLDPEIKKLSQYETYEIAFDLVSSNQAFATTIINYDCINKLEIISGSENVKEHIFGKTLNDHIHTAIGKAYATLTLCHPISDITTLHNRQTAILQLSKNMPYTTKMDTALNTIKNLEIKSLMPYASKTLVKQDVLNKQYFSKWLNPGGIINTNTIALELFADQYFLPIFHGRYIGMLLVTGLSLGQIAGIAYAGKLIAEKNNYNSYWQMTKDGTSNFINFIQNNKLPLKEKIQIIAAPMFFEFVITRLARTLYLQLKNNTDLVKHLQDGLIASATHINELKKLSLLINKNKQLLISLPSLQPLADFNDSTKHSAKLNKLLGMLDTNTFKGEPSFWSITGRVLAAYELMKQVKDELAPVFAAAGELDMYVALAKLYNSREGKDAQYCMVNFVENSATPVIDAQNFWNPFINPDTVVMNNATFDASCPNSILTGPNTGGKSTVIKGIMINILMAQTFGIAPSSSLTLTPFAKLNCFMNISDDIATGASLFKSEVMRAKKLLDMVQDLKENEFSFVIIDEVFTGTSPQEGEIAAMRFAKTLGSYTNNTSIIATHYPKMVNLQEETNGMFHNHHVEILRNEDGSLNRTFKLKNGPSFFNVAFDILKEEGLFV